MKFNYCKNCAETYMLPYQNTTTSPKYQLGTCTMCNALRNTIQQGSTTTLVAQLRKEYTLQDEQVITLKKILANISRNVSQRMAPFVAEPLKTFLMDAHDLNKHPQERFFE